MFIEDRLSARETEKRLDKTDIPRCKNCKYYSICSVGENDWCNNWEEDK